jgi:hypothetical protein
MDESVYKRHYETVQGLRLFDDTFATSFFQKPERVQYLLRILMDRDDLDVVYSETERCREASHH